MRSPDMKLLMDLFSETRGVEAALRILTVLDEEFMEAWKIKDFRLKADAVSQYCVCVHRWANGGWSASMYPNTTLFSL